MPAHRKRPPSGPAFTCDIKITWPPTKAGPIMQAFWKRIGELERPYVLKKMEFVIQGAALMRFSYDLEPGYTMTDELASLARADFQEAVRTIPGLAVD